MARARRKRRRRRGVDWGTASPWIADWAWILGVGVLALSFRGRKKTLPEGHEELIATAWEYLGVESPEVVAVVEAVRLTGDEVRAEDDEAGRRHWYRRSMFA